MKKNLFSVILLVIFCNNSLAKEKELSLDFAISDIAAELMKSPKMGKKEEWKKIVLTNFSDSIEFQNYIEEELTNKLINRFTIIKNTGSVSSSDFVLHGTFKDGKLTISAENVKKETVFQNSFSIKNDDILKKLRKNETSSFWNHLNSLAPSNLLDVDKGVDEALEHLTKKILAAKLNKVLVHNIRADKFELSEKVQKKIKGILANDIRIKLTNDTFETHAIIYGNIRPIGDDYRLFLYAVNVEDAKIIATYSKMLKGDKKEIETPRLPGIASNIKVEALSSDKIYVSWENDSNARNFIVSRVSGDKVEIRFAGTNGLVDFNLNKETEYCYFVQSQNTYGTGEVSEKICGITYGKPESYRHEIKIKETTGNSVTLTWDKVPGASYYNIKRDGASRARRLYNTVYKDTALQSSTNYRYVIEAENSAGTSEFSKTALTKPVPPTNIVAKPFADKINLEWQGRQRNISYYLIDGYSTKITREEITVPNLKPETDYQIRIKAVNDSGESEYSPFVNVRTLGKPSAPKQIIVKIDSNYYRKTVSIRWSPVHGANNYVIYRNGEKLTSTEDTFYEDNYSSLEKGKEYTYSVSAKNIAGESDTKDFSFLTEPSKPVITKKETIDNHFYIEWDPVPSAHKYHVYDKTKSDYVTVTDTFFKKGNLQYSSVLVYCVIAENRTGKSDCSEEIEVKTLDVPESPDELRTFAVSMDSIMLEWDAVQDAKSYMLYSLQKDRFGREEFKLIYNGKDTNFTHIGLEAGKEYNYAVVAENAAGESKKTRGKEKTLISAPTIEKIDDFGLDSIKITWKKSDGANYYKIYRKEGKGDSTEIGNTKPSYYGYDQGSQKTEYIDKNIESKKTYSYYVAAVDEKGKESISKAKEKKTAAESFLILYNKNDSGDIITSYEITKDSKIIKEESIYLDNGKSERISLPEASGYKISITTNKGKSIKGDSSFKIIENKETGFIYKVSLRPSPK